MKLWPPTFLNLSLLEQAHAFEDVRVAHQAIPDIQKPAADHPGSGADLNYPVAVASAGQRQNCRDDAAAVLLRQANAAVELRRLGIEGCG
jgi:isopentenyl diphosphate isomerase/L-lactate dehydrogenase-like FMN-dependent dehydrogenase